jgi:heptosyltransferase II
MLKYDLAIRLPNWVGDTVMAIPSILALKEQGIKCILIGKPWAKDLLEGLKIDIVSHPKKISDRIRRWKNIESSYVLLMTNSLSSAAAPRLALKKTIGMKTDHRSWFLSHGIDKNPGHHEVEYYWQLALHASKLFNKKIAIQPPQNLTLPISKKTQDNANEIITDHQLQNGFIMVCPMAKGLYKGQSKIWPHWNELINELKTQGKTIITCPAPDEVETCQQQHPHCQVIKNVNLGALAALCQKAECILSNDSGPMHIATATNSNTCGILGVTNPALTRPWGGHYIIDNNNWPSVSQVMQWISTLQQTEDRTVLA